MKSSNGDKVIANVVLRDRDFKILCFLFENKVASRDQINKYFFGGISKDTINRRLRKIVNLGLISRISLTPVGYSKYGYSLTQRGLARIKNYLPYNIKGKAISSECPTHDTALVEIRKAFEQKASVKRYFTENTLQSCTDLKEDEDFQPFIDINSDAAAFVDSKVGILKLAIELDTTHKSKSRYFKKIDEYYRKSGVDGVLYICMEKYNLKGLLKVDQKIADSHSSDLKIYFSLFDDVIGDDGEMIFTNANGSIFRVM